MGQREGWTRAGQGWRKAEQEEGGADREEEVRQGGGSGAGRGRSEGLVGNEWGGTDCSVTQCNCVTLSDFLTLSKTIGRSDAGKDCNTV